MAIEPDDSRLCFMPIEKAQIAPAGLCEHYKDRWWSFDSERGIIFWKPHKRSGLFPQCNSIEHTAISLTTKLYPWAETKFIPSVFVRANPNDYI